MTAYDEALVLYSANGRTAIFSQMCPNCGRFVAAREAISFGWNGQPVGDNADCAKCGPVAMRFEGYL